MFHDLPTSYAQAAYLLTGSTLFSPADAKEGQRAKASERGALGEYPPPSR